MLIQDDCRSSEFAPPAQAIEEYGLSAQILAPIVDGETLIGILAVHQADAPRRWAPEDIEAVGETVLSVHRLLEEGFEPWTAEETPDGAT